MDNGKPVSLTVSGKINIFVQADTHTQTHIEQASQLSFSAHTKPYCKEP
jgi:hypothetical protein